MTDKWIIHTLEYIPSVDSYVHSALDTKNNKRIDCKFFETPKNAFNYIKDRAMFQKCGFNKKISNKNHFNFIYILHFYDLTKDKDKKRSIKPLSKSKKVNLIQETMPNSGILLTYKDTNNRNWEIWYKYD